MQKDITIPQVEGVYVAAILEFNETHRTHDWNVYLINAKSEALETIFIVSKGHDARQKTSVMRHKLAVLPAKSFAKVEFIEDSVLKLNNEFSVSFFLDGKLYDKTFVFKANTIKETKLKEIPVIPEKGILAE
tara:strand:+ start:41882 stop:42277 length:396 start_codon:yes stop_codon:yes gene_type:complete